MPIPKNIFTIWLTFEEGPLPPLIQRCIESQKLPGYTHKLITLDNCYKGSRYVNEAIGKARELFWAGNPAGEEIIGHVNWLVKGSDWLRCYHICEEGGIFLDADMEVLPGKNFDDLLDNRFFTEREVYGYAANSGFGSEAGHPFLKEYMEKVESNFRGDGFMVFEPGVRAFTDLMWTYEHNQRLMETGIRIYDTNMFFP